MRFADIYPLDAYTEAAGLSWFRTSSFSSAQQRDPALAQAYREAGAKDAADRKVLDAHKANVFGPAINSYLLHLREEGRLNTLNGSRGREAWLITEWNDFVSGKSDDFSFGDHFLVASLIRVDEDRHAERDTRPPGEHPVPSAERIQECWNTLCAAVEAGTITWFEAGCHFEGQDQKNGDRMRIALDGWKATLLVWNKEHKMVPAEDIAPLPLTAVEFDVPTGDLLITDTLRVEGFNDGIDFGDEEWTNELSLNTDLGQSNRTALHADRHGLGFVQTTNTFCDVLQGPDGRLIVIDSLWDEKAPAPVAGGEVKKVGTFSCDIWRSTAIDRSVAIETMRRGGCSNPEEVLSAYLASDDCYAKNVVQLKVAPGRYRLHSGPDFSKRANRKKLGIPKGTQAWLVLEKIA